MIKFRVKCGILDDSSTKIAQYSLQSKKIVMKCSKSHSRCSSLPNLKRTRLLPRCSTLTGPNSFSEPRSQNPSGISTTILAEPNTAHIDTRPRMIMILDIVCGLDCLIV